MDDLREDRGVAAPPDAGGHHGFDTRPDEMLQVEDEHRPHPDTSWQPARPRGEGSGSWPFWALLLALLVLAAFIIYSFALS